MVWYVFLAHRYEIYSKNNAPGVNPSLGSILPLGGSNLNDLPSTPISESVIGLNERFPEKAMAVTISGDARKFIVLLLASLRPLKLRLKEVRIAARRH